ASGSIIRGIFKVMKKRKAQAVTAPRERLTLQTFREGNETLIGALAAKLGERLRCSTCVTAIEPLDSGLEPTAPRFRLTLHSPHGTETVEAERLVLAVPPNVAGSLLAPVHPQFECELCPVEYAGVAVVSLGYRREDIGNSLDGFGFLVPRSSRLNVLGTVWNSSLFPGRAPEGQALLTSFVGG